jgi:hypothetical protein
MKKIYFLPIALAAGFVAAFIAAGVHSLFFCLLPLLAFVFGYFSSWRWGLLSGFLLFLGYTIATALMWHTDLNVFYPFQYIYAFFAGGFSIVVVGALAPLVRRGIRRVSSIVVLAVLAFVVVGCGIEAWPSYSYYNQVIIHFSEDVGDLELYLPVGVVDDEICRELYENPLDRPNAPLTRDYTVEIVTTEYGEMVKLTVNELIPEGPMGYPYTANIIFKLPGTSRQMIELMPRYDVRTIDEVSWGRYIGPLTVTEHIDIKEFETPIIVIAPTDVRFELILWNRTDWGSSINFAYGKSYTYTELISYEGDISGDWVMVPVEVTGSLNIRGTGD